MPNDVVIREATLDDIDPLLVLLEELFDQEADFTYDERKQRQGLAILLAEHTDHTVMVAQVADRIVGMCAIQIIVSTAQGRMAGLVEDFIVTESYMRQGLGTALIQAIERWAKEQGVNRLQLLADRNNQVALDFYKKNQWTVTQLVGLRKYI